MIIITSSPTNSNSVRCLSDMLKTFKPTIILDFLRVNVEPRSIIVVIFGQRNIIHQYIAFLSACQDAGAIPFLMFTSCEAQAQWMKSVLDVKIRSIPAFSMVGADGIYALKEAMWKAILS